MLQRLIWNTYTRDLVIFILQFFPIKTKRTFFICWNGTKFGCNPKAIAEELYREHKDFEIAFAFVEPQNYANEFPPYFKSLELGSLYYFYYLATSKFIVSNTRFAQIYFPYKKSNQKYIFTGHGSFGIKKIEFDAEKVLNPNYLKLAVEDTRRTDLMISNADFRTRVFRSAYRYNGEVIDKGIPRNDKLFSLLPSNVQKMKKDYVMQILPQKLGNIENIKFLVYAPTFRANSDYSVYGFNIDNVINSLTDKFGGEWFILISSHPNMLKYYREVYNFSHDRVIDIAKYDLQSFLPFSDILITDYSSAEMDFSLLRKPVFQLCKDIDKYDRGFYIDPKTLPFPFAASDSELCNNILNFDNNKYQADLEKFNTEVIGLKETGHAAEYVVEWIFKHTL